MMSMNFRRLYVCSLMVFGCIGQLFAAEPTISVAIQPWYPWNGNVDVQFTITGESGVKYDTSFTAKDVAGGTNLTMKTLYKSNGAAANPVKEQLLPGNYNWVWDAQADLGANTVFERVTVTAETTPSIFTYSVKFNANGGTGTMANETFTSGTAKALTANAFTCTGYTFQGWATSASGAKVYSDKQSVSDLTETANATVNLYAVWKANTYSVKFNANGGTGTMANESFTYGTAKALTANTFTRAGYTFQGWATSATGAKVYSDKQSVNNLATTAGATVNLYAVWAPVGVQLWANGPYWAECNLGATKPEAKGAKYAWGSTIAGDSSSAAPSVSNSELKTRGYIDSSGNLVLGHDAATSALGAPWRMPTKSEFQALLDNTTGKATSLNGVFGWRFTGKNDFSGRSIFIPMPDRDQSTSLAIARLWSSTPYEYAYYGYFGFCLFLNPNVRQIEARSISNESYIRRSCLYYIRPVHK